MICTINSKIVTLPDNLKLCSGYSFTSGTSVDDVNVEDKRRSITDLILCCVSVGMDEKQIAKLSGIDVVSILGKMNKTVSVKSSTKDKLFEYKNKKFYVSDLGFERIAKYFK